MSRNYGYVIHRSSGPEEAANLRSFGNLAVVRALLRIVIGVLIAALVWIAAIPLLVLRNLNSGGTGWGLCERGVEGCSNSYFSGFELVAALVLGLLVIAVLLRVATRSLRWVEHHHDRMRSGLTLVDDGGSSVGTERGEGGL